MDDDELTAEKLEEELRKYSLEKRQFGIFIEYSSRLSYYMLRY